ncbi:MAG: DUF819 family protein [Spirochaetes bacterium]|nr:DUF819 family protein [Spirochaetota bacterium]
MKLIILAVFFLVCPALIIHLCKRFPKLDKVGPALLCYATGILIANIGVLPEGSGQTQTTIMNISIPLALPLLLFSFDIRRWVRLAGKAFLSFICLLLAVLIATTLAYIIFHDSLDESWKVAGMLIGVYSGGSINLNTIGLALQAKEHILVLTNTADMLMCTPYFLFVLSYAQRLFNKFLPPFCMPAADPSRSTECEEVVVEDLNDYSGIFSIRIILPLVAATVMSAAIFAVSYIAYQAAPRDFNMAALMISITTLGIAASFVPKIRNIKMTFHWGQYILMVFCVVVGSLADLRQIVLTAPVIFVFTGIVIYVSMLIHLLLSKLFKIDTDTMIITSVAGVFSPPFVPVVAAALKNKEVIVSGIATGILGWVIGNYLGITYGYFLRSFFH